MASAHNAVMNLALVIVVFSHAAGSCRSAAARFIRAHVPACFKQPARRSGLVVCGLFAVLDKQVVTGG